MPDKMIRCPEGHFYDPSRHQACPWCALPADQGPSAAEKTRPVRPGGFDAPPLPQGVPPAMPQQSAPPPMPADPGMPPPMPAAGAAPANATRRVGQPAPAARGADPVVGWLVCLEGPDRGRDFRLHAEKNFMGRAPSMDVCIPGDDTISRERHGVIIFDPKKQVFWVLPGDASGLVYLNGDIVHSPSQIKADDVLELGQTKLVLVPFCGDKYSWNPTAAPSA